MSQDVVSFVLRFVREASEDQQARWRGVVRHVQSNAESQFTQFADALAFMQAQIDATLDAATATPNPPADGARLWEDVLPRYQQLWRDAFSPSHGGSSVMSKAIEQTLNATLGFWGLPTLDDQQRAADQVQALSAQVATLTQRIAELEALLAARKADNPPTAQG